MKKLIAAFLVLASCAAVRAQTYVPNSYSSDQILSQVRVVDGTNVGLYVFGSILASATHVQNNFSGTQILEQCLVEDGSGHRGLAVYLAGGGGGVVTCPLLATCEGSGDAPAYSWAWAPHTGLFATAQSLGVPALGITAGYPTPGDAAKRTGGVNISTHDAIDGTLSHDPVVAGNITLTAGLGANGGANGFINLTSDVVSQGPGGANRSALLMEGAWFSGGSGTTTLPHVLIQPSGATAATTWDIGGTGLGIDADVAAGMLIDARVDGVRKFSVDIAGQADTGNVLVTTDGGTGYSAPSIFFGARNNSSGGVIMRYQSAYLFMNGDGSAYSPLRGSAFSTPSWDYGYNTALTQSMGADVTIAWSGTNGDSSAAKDLGLKRIGTSAAKFTDASTGYGQLATSEYSVTGITASTTQTQGQGALTGIYNVVSTCANELDTVTAPSASAGLPCRIQNDGAKTLKVYPASGDNLGAGVDYSVRVLPGAVVSWETRDTTTWRPVAYVDQPYPLIYDVGPATALLVHAEGSGAAFVDSAPGAVTVTAHGDATQSATQAKFGTKSASFDGTGDYISVAVSEANTFRASDFTVDFWCYPTANGKATYGSYIWSRAIPDGIVGGYTYILYQNAGAATISLYVTSVGGTYDIANDVACGSLTLNAWQHVAIVRYGGSIGVYVDGSPRANVICGAKALNEGASDVISFGGATADPLGVVNDYGMTGFIDEIRIQKGYAMFRPGVPPTSATFTTPAAAYAP